MTINNTYNMPAPKDSCNKLSGEGDVLPIGGFHYNYHILDRNAIQMDFDDNEHA